MLKLNAVSRKQIQEHWGDMSLSYMKSLDMGGQIEHRVGETKYEAGARFSRGTF